MNWIKVNIKNFLIIFFLSFIIASNFLAFVDIGFSEKNDCCGAGCQCNNENHCEDFVIDCQPTNVVLLIPMVNINEYQQFETNDNVHFTLNLDIDYDLKDHFIEISHHNPILKPPYYSINAPLLI